MCVWWEYDVRNVGSKRILGTININTNTTESFFCIKNQQFLWWNNGQRFNMLQYYHLTIYAKPISSLVFNKLHLLPYEHGQCCQWNPCWKCWRWLTFCVYDSTYLHLIQCGRYAESVSCKLTPVSLYQQGQRMLGLQC